MKPENILLRQKGSSAIKVIDFGSGCFESQRSKYYIKILLILDAIGNPLINHTDIHSITFLRCLLYSLYYFISKFR